MVDVLYLNNNRRNVMMNANSQCPLPTSKMLGLDWSKGIRRDLSLSETLVVVANVRKTYEPLNCVDLLINFRM